MLKVCGDTICKRLETIFTQALLTSSASIRMEERELSTFIKKYDKKKSQKLPCSQFVIRFLKDLFLKGL